MRKRHELLPGGPLERSVHLWAYGHWGAPVVVFPSAAGMAHEWEAQGMIDALTGLVEGGKIKLYCTESNIAETWTHKEADPAWRAHRHRCYERFVVDSLVPWVRRDCGSEQIPLATAGCSLGGYYAATLALKEPETFRWALAMSGRYEISHFTGGFSNLDVYFSNPLAFVANLEGKALERVQQHTRLTLVCGQGPWEEGCIGDTHALADQLAAKGIPHERDIWGYDVSHGWEWWQRQARHHLGRAFGG